MKWSFLLFSSFLCLQAIAQYPATGNKMRLGWQTTGDGLVYRGAIGDTATLDPSGLNNAWMLLDTANGNLYAYRAKAWRLVSGGGGGVTMPFDSVTFNVNETDASLRELKYSEEKGYLQYGGQDSVQIPLLPGIWYVRNDTSVTIPKGTVVRATGTLGASGRIKVKHMIANGSIDAMYILGIAMQDIAVGADGYVMTQGKIRKINTQAYSEGAVLYADVDTLGGLTQTEPTGSNLKLPIAFVVNSASNGTIAVRVTSGAYMRDLHDAEITSPVSNASLYYNAAQGVWRDTTGAVLTSDTSVFARDFQISGTTNYLAKFTGSNAVGNSVAFNTGRNLYFNSTQGNTSNALTNSFEFNGYGSAALDQPFLAVIGNVGSTANHRPRLAMYRTAGDTANSRALVPYNYYLGSLQWNAADGVDMLSTGAEITAITDSITGENDMPTALTFATTANGAASTTERMRITSAGNVGIKNPTPTNMLDVGHPTNSPPTEAAIGINSTSSGGTAKVAFANGSVVKGDVLTTSNATIIGTGGMAIQTTTNHHIIFRTNSSGVESGGNERMRILNGGNVGIATASPDEKLHINGSLMIERASDTLGSGGIFFKRPGTSSYNWLIRQGAYPGTNDDLFIDRNIGGTWYTGIAIDRENLNVGIGTASPSRPLHVAGTTAIRIPVGNFAQRGTSDNGDIRVRTDTASMEYYSGAWRTVAPMARVPQSGLANRFSKFDANGLLDTSAVLTQSNGRIGINATPTEQLQVGGTVRATRFNVNTFSTQVVSINNFAPTGAGSLGGNLWIGSGGQSSSWTIGDDACCNLSIGSNALQANTTGAFNLAIGESALAQNTTGDGNIAIGRGAIAQSAQELNSIAIGAYSLQKNNNTTGENIAIGYAAMGASVNTRYNVAVGSNALSGTTGNENVAIGRNALLYGTSGGNNTAVGYSSLERITTGSNNVAIGWEAGKYFGASTANLNETSSTSIYIGKDARASANGNSNEIVIGEQGRGNGSNTTTIGNSSTTNTVIPAGSLTVDVMRRKAPVTVTGNHTVADGTSWLICNGTAAIALTLPAASSWTGREIMVKTIQPQAVNSASSNVVPIDGTATGTAILPATDGAWCTLVSDGTNWIIMQRGT